MKKLLIGLIPLLMIGCTPNLKNSGNKTIVKYYDNCEYYFDRSEIVYVITYELGKTLNLGIDDVHRTERIKYDLKNTLYEFSDSSYKFIIYSVPVY